MGPRAAALDRFLRELCARIGSQRFDMWFAHTRLRINGQRLEVHTDSRFVANSIDSRFAVTLRSVAHQVLGPAFEIDMKVAPASEADQSQRPTTPASIASTGDAIPDSHAGANEHSAPRPRIKAAQFRRLEEFVVGTSNKLAYAAALRLAEQSDARCISPLFIHGECGVGKTHLLQGVCQRFIELTRRSQHVRYVTGEQFTNEYITAIRNNTIDAFRQKIRKRDLLAIDDVHFLSNKTKTQAEFLYTLDAIDLSGARVVLASDNHPHHITRFNQALVSRFLSGMVVKVEKPDHAMRAELIQRQATARGLRINAAAVDLIASQCLGSVRELEGAITKLAALKTMMNGHAQVEAGGEIGIVLAEQLFREQMWRPTHTVRLAAVIEGVCARLAVPKADILASGRHRRVVLARGLVAYLARELTTHSFPEIAQAMGRSNHSTIHTADQRLRRQLHENESVDLGAGDPAINLKELIDQLRRAIIERKP